jgi:hypothetical protein
VSLIRKLAIIIVTMASMSVGHADLVWSIDLHDPAGVVGPSRILFINGTLTNSLSSTENLGVIGGFVGVPPGFDYEVGGFASIPNGYLSRWGSDGAFAPQFEGVNLAPGMSFDFEFMRFTPDASVAPGNSYSTWLQFQLFEASSSRPMIGTSFDSVSWTVVNEQVVGIDIKPGKDPNNIKASSRQKIFVAILTAGSFNALDVNFETVAFGPNGATELRGRAKVKDVDRDGDMDLLLRFDTQDTGIACGDTEATLTGMTFGGEAIAGTDTIVTTNCP